MEQNGVHVDAAKCREKEEVAVNHELETLVALDTETELLGKPEWLAERENADDVWSSPLQLLRLLDDLGAARSPVGAKGKLKAGKNSTDWAAMAWISKTTPHLEDLCSLVVKLKRVRSGLKYLRKLPLHINPKTGRIHPVTGPADDDDDRVGAISGRLGMKNPEGQQIPKDPKKDPYRIREVFTAGAGRVLVTGDYSALEVVVLAHMAKKLFGDSQLEEMTAPGAPDIHGVNARKVFGEILGWKLSSGQSVASLSIEDFKEHKEAKVLRDMVKAVWYGLMYGKGAYGFGNTLKGADGKPIGEKRAEELVEGFLTAVPSLRKYQQWVYSQLKTVGEVRSIAGRACYVSHLLDDKWAFGAAYRRSLNFPMQASSADLVALATIEAAKMDNAVLVLQVHDELVLECNAADADEVSRKLKQIMLDAGPALGLCVELQVSVGKGNNWHECK